MTDASSFLPLPDMAAFWNIQRHFLDRALDMEALSEVLVPVAAVVGALLLLILALHFRPKKPYIPQDWILEPEEIRKVVSIAINQRAKFEIHFAAEGEARRPALRCSGVEVTRNEILLEASGLASLSSRWHGKTVDCFFMLRKQETYLFYSFKTAINTITTERDISLIGLGIPARIESRQKRSYLRINPPEEYMLGAAVWRGPDMPDQALWNDLAQWPKPSRIWLPGMREEFTVRDISSGGMRLHIPRHILTEEMDLIHISTQFIVMLDLWEPDKAQRLRFWLLCRMQSPVLDFETKGMDLGAQFLAWAKPAEPGSSSLLWLKLASSGEVEPLGNWIMRRHLEFFRESEQVLGFAKKQQA